MITTVNGVSWWQNDTMAMQYGNTACLSPLETQYLLLHKVSQLNLGTPFTSAKTDGITVI